MELLWQWKKCVCLCWHLFFAKFQRSCDPFECRRCKSSAWWQIRWQSQEYAAGIFVLSFLYGCLWNWTAHGWFTRKRQCNPLKLRILAHKIINNVRNLRNWGYLDIQYCLLFLSFVRSFEIPLLISRPCLFRNNPKFKKKALILCFLCSSWQSSVRKIPQCCDSASLKPNVLLEKHFRKKKSANHFAYSFL